MKLKGLILIAAVFLTFLYIYQQVDPVRISYEIKSNKKILAGLKEKNALLRYKLALLVSPPNLEKEIENRNIQLCLGDRLRMVELIAYPIGHRENRGHTLSGTGKTEDIIKKKYFIQGFLESLLSKRAEAEQK